MAEIKITSAGYAALLRVELETRTEEDVAKDYHIDVTELRAILAKHPEAKSNVPSPNRQNE